MAALLKSFRLLMLASALAPTTTWASPAGPLHVQDTTCSAVNVQACPAGLPNNFCCPLNSSCIPLAGNTTALCCPAGQNCDKIQPIACDVRLQDPDQSGNSPIKTSIFDVALEKCGSDLCCPFGYSCSGGGQCSKNADQSKSPRDSPPASTPTTTSADAAPTVTSPASDVSPGTATASAPASTTTADSSSSGSGSGASNPRTVSIIGGVIGGCAVLILAGVIVVLFIRRNRRRGQGVGPEKANAAKFKNISTVPKGNVISDPIMQPNSYRTDFILKSPSAASSVSQRPPQLPPTHTFDRPPRLSIPNPFDSPNPSALSPAPSQVSSLSDDEHNARTGHVVARLPPIRAMKASSTRVITQNVQREPSSESINVFADPTTVAPDVGKRGTQATTFTDLMFEADLGDVREGKPYVPGTTPRI